MPRWQWVELVLRVFFLRCYRRGREAFPGETCSLSLPVLKQRLGIWICQCRTLHVLLVLKQEVIWTSQWIAYAWATWKGSQVFFLLYASFMMALMVKNLPALLETWVQSLGQAGPLEKRIAIHSSIFTWRIPWTEEPGKLQSIGSQKSRTWLSN